MAHIRSDSNDKDSSYEEVRKQRVEENKRRLEELGILSLSKSLSDSTKPLQKSPKSKSKKSNTKSNPVEVRRSSRERNSVASYADEFSIELPCERKRSKPGSWTSYLARPIDEVKFASYEEKVYAKQCAENFRSTLKSGPSFVKSMVRSHVYSCFWLGLPAEFCEKHLPSFEVTMFLEDADGLEYESIYKAEKRGLSGGWRGFALAHKINEGDALVFQLIETERFKIHIFRASELHTAEAVNNSNKKTNQNSNKKATKNSNKKGTNSRKNVELKKDVESDAEINDHSSSLTVNPDRTLLYQLKTVNLNSDEFKTSIVFEERFDLNLAPL
ncbi:B3 domain-containing protein [Thalictrum thalictroides]|uniref:B3 domain-containing protein n=1 Tax=Thalictrum thalictroides TaxID=46969 RepID=A0A7J6WPT7_THATH|nr:B3 domain-containing protein [Thalictrum thalictroides]